MRREVEKTRIKDYLSLLHSEEPFLARLCINLAIQYELRAVRLARFEGLDEIVVRVDHLDIDGKSDTG